MYVFMSPFYMFVCISYTEDHLMTLWSLSVKIITDHSQHLKYFIFLFLITDC